MKVGGRKGLEVCGELALHGLDYPVSKAVV